VETFLDEGGGGKGTPCSGDRQIVRVEGRELAYDLADIETRTVKGAIKELRERLLTARPLDELRLIDRLAPEQAAHEVRLAHARAAWAVLFLDERVVPEDRNLVLVPDPEPQDDLQTWRSLTWLPATLEPMGLPEGM